MAGSNRFPQRRQYPGCHGSRDRAISHLVVPLGHEPTAMRTTDTAGLVPAESGAVSPLIGVSVRRGDVDSTNDRSTVRTPTTPGARTRRTATRTTGTRTTRTECSRSADGSDAAFSSSELVQAWTAYRRNKRGTPGAMGLEQDIGARLVDLEERLLDGDYRPGRSICFVVEHPKVREVWAAEPVDRIVHHLLYNHVGPGLERTWIADSCACIPGRGTLYAVERLEHHIRSQTQNWSRPGCYLKCDVANFFPSIHKPTLAGILDRVIREPWWLDLALRILFHDPRKNYELRSSPEQLARVPGHKSLFNQGIDHGLAIGNLTSQVFANVQLNPLDQFIKRGLGVRHYVRYVDDFVLLHESAQQLNAWLDEISAFLRSELRLELNTSKTIRQPIDRGVDFVGQVIKPWHRTTRRRTFRSVMARIEEMDAEDLYEVANSAFGLFRQATHSHADRAALAGRLLRRGMPVNHRLTKAYRMAA